MTPPTHEQVQRSVVDQKRYLRAQEYPADRVPNRNAVARGISILHGLSLMSSKNTHVWLRASKMDEKKLEQISYQVLQSPTPDEEVPAVILDRVVVAFNLEKLLPRDPMEGMA